jgi:urea transport system permease protein
MQHQCITVRQTKFGLRLQASRVWLFFCALALVSPWLIGAPSAASPSAASLEQLPRPPVPPEIAPYLVQLAGQDAADRTAAIIALGKRGDPRLLPLFEALREGGLYAWNAPDGRRQPVMAGEKLQHAGQPVLPLLDAYTQEPLASPDGTPLAVAPEALEAIEADRRVRQLLKPLIDSLRNRRNLASPEEAMRRSAATDLGNLGNPAAIPWLEEALAGEPNRWVRHTMAESIQLLKLAQDDAAVRLAAVQQLGRLRAARALPALQEMSQATAAEGKADPALRAAVTTAIEQIEAWGMLAEAVETVFRGISLSSVLLLMALGLAVIFGLMGVINMAHGELMMLGAYATFLVQEGFRAYVPVPLFDYYFLLALPVSFVVAGACGLLLEVSLIRFLYGRPLETLLATWGVSLILIQAARKAFGDLTSVVSPSWLSGGVQLMVGVQLPYNRLFILGLAMACVAGMYLVLFRTSLGLKVRAVTQNRDMSACLGVSTRRVDAGVFALGAGLAGIAGCALTQIGNVDPGLGQNYIVDSFLVVVTGGVGKLAGTIAAAFGIGGFSKLLEPSFGAIYAKILLLLLVIVFLQRRPLGLFVTKGRGAES